MTVVIWSGLTLGAVYSLVATGFTLMILPTGVFNFAHGAVVAAGSFLTYQWLALAHLPTWVAVILNAVIGALLGLACEVLAVRTLRRRGGSTGSSTIVTTVGASLALIGGLGVRWGYNPLQVPFTAAHVTARLFGVVASLVEILLVVVAIVVAVVLHVWFRRSRPGRAALAVAEDREAAMLRGINVNRMSLIAFGAAGAYGAAAGILVGPITYAMPSLGTTLALGGFVAVALGGQTSFLGGMIGGLVVGLVESFVTRYLNANYSDIAVLVVLLITLLVRPKGIGGAGEARSV
jgi:branched-chain amino acid transport system permease protein